MSDPRLSTEERTLLEQVDSGCFDGPTATPPALQHLIELGLIERSATLLLPMIPSGSRYRLTPLGRQWLGQGRKPGE